MPPAINIRDIISIENEKNLIEKYQSGDLITNLSNQFSLPRHHIYIILKRNSIKTKNNKIKDLTNKIFDKLTVTRYYDTINEKRRWACICACGNIIIVATFDLIMGHTTSCGCNRRSDNPRGTTIKKVFVEDYSDGNLPIEIFYNLSQMNCHYCAIAPSNLRKYAWGTRPDYYDSKGDFIFNGLDRVNSDLPHNIDNVITACFQCNRSKGDTNYHDFVSHVKNLYFNLKKYDFIIKIIEKNDLDQIPLNMNDIYSSGKVGQWKGKSKYLPQASVISSVHKIYKSIDKKINRDFDISFEDFFKLTQMNCFYCGSIPKKEASLKQTKCSENRIKNSYIRYNGLDRVNSSIGHVIGNVVPCCYTCNWMKSNKSYDFFIQWIEKIATNLNFNGVVA